MARMHSRKKGQSGSTRPLDARKPTWIRYKPKEIELLIVKLAKEGKTASEIGLVLRDSYGVPDVKRLTEKSVTQIMNEKKIAPEVPEDLFALMERSVIIRTHLENNKQDMTALRGLQLTEAKINRLAKYYKLKGKLALDWKYDPARVRLATR